MHCSPSTPPRTFCTLIFHPVARVYRRGTCVDRRSGGGVNCRRSTNISPFSHLALLCCGQDVFVHLATSCERFSYSMIHRCASGDATVSTSFLEPSLSSERENHDATEATWVDMELTTNCLILQLRNLNTNLHSENHEIKVEWPLHRE